MKRSWRRFLMALGGYALWTPEIGQPVHVDGRAQSFMAWWESGAMNKQPQLAASRTCRGCSPARCSRLLVASPLFALAVRNLPNRQRLWRNRKDPR